MAAILDFEDMESSLFGKVKLPDEKTHPLFISWEFITRSYTFSIKCLNISVSLSDHHQ